MRSGHRLELAILFAKKEAVDGPAIPRTALGAPGELQGLDPDEGARLAQEYSKTLVESCERVVVADAEVGKPTYLEEIAARYEGRN